MDKPIFSLCYTSRRPQAIRAMVKEWRSKAEHPEQVEVVITVDADDVGSQQQASKVVDARVYVQPDLPGNCVKGWNLAAHYSTGHVLIAMADDFVPPEKWDTQLLAVSDPGWIHRDHVVLVNDGYCMDLCTLGIATRTRVNKQGYLFYPVYKSMFNDTEQTYHARQDEVLISALNLIFEHHHPDCKLRERDAVDLVHSSSERYAESRAIYERRRFRCFPLDIKYVPPPDDQCQLNLT